MEFISKTAVIDRDNVDTDVIIPAKYLYLNKKDEIGQRLFENLKYGLDQRIFDIERSILLGRKNFGCGSSREHAVWALQQAGFKIIIAESFAPVFYNNAIKNRLLPIELDALAMQKLIMLSAEEDVELEIDLTAKEIRILQNSLVIPFNFDEHCRTLFLKGLTELEYILKFTKDIEKYEKNK